MATVVTVHGTFASGETKGERWWQNGSGFEQDLQRFVQGQERPLVVEPLVWDGKNSETSRRAGGAVLARRVRELEMRGERYVLIGHSHGGSVILAAILQSVSRGRTLTALSRWITVGTPFIAFTPKRGLFSRLGLGGRAAYMSLLTLLVMLGAITFAGESRLEGAFLGGLLVLLFGLAGYRALDWVSRRELARSGSAEPASAFESLLWPRFNLALGLLHAVIIWIALNLAVAMVAPNATFTPVQGVLAASGVLAAASLLHLGLAWLNRRWARAAEIKRSAILAPVMAAMLGLRHRHDEAIAGLGRVHEIDFRIFGRNLVVSQFMFAAVLAVPVLLLGILMSPRAMTWLADQFHYWSGNEGVMLVHDGQAFVENVRFLIKVLSVHVLLGLFPAGPEISGWDMLRILLGLLLLPVLFFCFSLVVIALARAAGYVVSDLLSRALDRVAWGQIRASAFGADLFGEQGLYARPQPAMATSRQAPLPDALGGEITAVSDAASARSVSKLRMAIADLAFSGEGREKAELVSDYLSWDELIHTAYFKVSRFNKLVAYAVAASPGFAPTAEFRADPDFPLVASWYEAIVGGENKPANVA